MKRIIKKIYVRVQKELKNLVTIAAKRRRNLKGGQRGKGMLQDCGLLSSAGRRSFKRFVVFGGTATARGVNALG